MIGHRRLLTFGALLSAPVAALALAVGTSLLAPRALSQPAAPAKPLDLQATATVACITCHSAATGKESAHPFGKKVYASHTYILLNEGVTWQQSDPHSKAFKKLDGRDGTDNALAKSIGEKLGYDVAGAVQCRTCHATDKSPTSKPDARSDRFDLDSGVSCAACHGVSKAWQVEHYQEVDGKLPWREKTATAKIKEKVEVKLKGEDKEWGLADLRNPAVKANLCVSCHIGNPDEGKVVTHEMYAAGHPPLPPFELSTFQEGQPRHWARPTDKRLKYFEGVTGKDRWDRFRYHPAVGDAEGESSVARDHAVGTIAALRAEAALLVDDAERAIREKDSIDFARFDCYACHHDLKVPSDRQKGATDRAPGRPPLRANVGPPASIVAEHGTTSPDPFLAEVSAGFPEKWDALKKAAVVRPFGNPEAVSKAGQEMRTWCDAFLKYQRVCPTPIYTKNESTRLLEMIAKRVEASAIADPELAMVMTWAYLNLARDLKKPLAGDALKSLQSGVPLELRAEPFSAGDSPKPIDIGARAKLINAFDADPFREAFGKLHSAR